MIQSIAIRNVLSITICQLDHLCIMQASPSQIRLTIYFRIQQAILGQIQLSLLKSGAGLSSETELAQRMPEYIREELLPPHGATFDLPKTVSRAVFEGLKVARRRARTNPQVSSCQAPIGGYRRS